MTVVIYNADGGRQFHQFEITEELWMAGTLEVLLNSTQTPWPRNLAGRSCPSFAAFTFNDIIYNYKKNLKEETFKVRLFPVELNRSSRS
jgi:hypothetical protein